LFRPTPPEAPAAVAELPLIRLTRRKGDTCNIGLIAHRPD